MKVKDIIAEVQSDIQSEGISNYEASYHSDLHIEEVSNMNAQEASEFFLAVLDGGEYMDSWVGAVLNQLSENREQYGLTKEWFDTILEHENLAIF